VGGWGRRLAVTLLAAGFATAAAGDDAASGGDVFRAVVGHLEAGRIEAAAQALAGVTEAPAASPEGALAGWLWRHVAEVALAAGAVGQAAEAVTRIPEAVGRGDLPLRIARLRAETGDLAGARAALGDVEALPAAARPEAWALLAELHAEAGAREAAREGFWQLHFDHAGHPAARDAYGRLLDLSEPGDAMPGAADWLARVEGLLDRHHNDEAIAAAEALFRHLTEGHPLGCRLGLLLGSAHRKARNYREAIETLEPVVADCHEEAIARDALWTLASATWILEGDPAVPLYERFAETWPDHGDADRALYLAAARHHREGRLAEARAVLETQLRRFPEGSGRPGALWRRFWIDLEDGRAHDGLPFLDAILEDAGADGASFHAERARYWRARILAEAGAEAAAADALEDLFRSHPLSYYWLMARDRLLRLDPERAERLARDLPAPGSDVSATRPGAEAGAGALEAVPEAWVGRRLLDLGLGQLGAAALRRAEPAVAERGPEPLLALALVLDAAGDAHRAHWLIRTRARGFDRRWPDGDHARIWRAAYPRAFATEVEAAAGEAGIDPWLLQALIREESALVPDAVSWAGAVGLAQMMPRTAADVAGRMGLDSAAIDRTALKDPALNLRIAARHLADLLDLFRENPVLAIAAYNAGERTVMGWALEGGGAQTDVFIESIPIAETQRYTRRVLRSWATYRFLYAEAEDRLISLPADVRVE
jgi:soluble lytic murein transglycosylase